jgi:competence protein ComEA
MNNIIKKYNVYIKVAVLAIIIGVCGILYCIHKNSNNNNNDITIDISKQNNTEKQILEKETQTQQTNTSEIVKESELATVNQIYVHICGSVNNSGVYMCDSNSRLFEVIELAGGFTQEADETYLNLVEKISDGQRIYVPSKEEVLTGNIENISQVNNNQAQSNIATSLININTASKEQLMTLPGIGEAKALDIISYRSTNGNFKNTEDIKNISGIKESAYSKIKDLICT